MLQVQSSCVFHVQSQDHQSTRLRPSQVRDEWLLIGASEEQGKLSFVFVWFEFSRLDTCELRVSLRLWTEFRPTHLNHSYGSIQPDCQAWMIHHVDLSRSWLCGLVMCSGWYGSRARISFRNVLIDCCIIDLENVENALPNALPKAPGYVFNCQLKSRKLFQLIQFLFWLFLTHSKNITNT